MKNIDNKHVENKIYVIRNEHVMLDSDLAILYETETKFINRAVKRNLTRFPEGFIFQLSENEWMGLNQENTNLKNENLKYQTGTSSFHGGRRTLPYVFTEQGVAMLSAVLKSEVAVNVSIQIMKAFVNMRRFLSQNASIFQRLDQLELKQLRTHEQLNQIFKALEAGKPQPDKGIFFEGQIFDAYSFVVDLIKKANTEIILIDNYVDESILTLLSKRNKNVAATIFTKAINNKLRLDIEKHNAQYPAITIKCFAQSHDRFLIIDGQILYHIGASLKDLGKKWFAFSRMDSLVTQVLSNLKMAD